MPESLTPASDDAAAGITPVTTPPPRKKRRWLRVIGVLLALLVLLILLLPTIFSLAPVRSLVVSRAGGYLNGKLEIQSWSFGWFSGTRIDGVKIYDKSNVLVAEADHIDTGLTLLNLIRQDFNLGHSVIDVNATKLVVNKNGNINYLDLLPPGKSAERADTKSKSDKSGQPVSVPNVKGDIELHLRGSIQLVDDAGKSVDVELRQGSGGTIKIVDINQGVSPDLKLLYDVNGKSPSEIDVAGDVDVVQNNRLNLANLTAKVKLALKDVDLGAAQPLMAMAGVAGATISGTANGEINTDLQPGQAGGAKGEIVVTRFAFSGPQIADAYSADAVHLPVNVTRSITSGKTRDVIDIKAILPEANVAIAGDVPEAAIESLSKKIAPGDTGWLSITTTVDAAKTATAFPKTLHLWADAKINSGQLVNKIDIAIQPTGLVTKTQTDLAVAGTRAGKAQSILPISVSTSAGLTLPTAAAELSLMSAAHDLSLALTSDFAHFTGGGSMPAKLQGEGAADLDKLRSQLAQFCNLGDTKLAGQADVALKSTAAGNAITLNAVANVNKLLLGLPGQPLIDLPFVKTVVDAAATLPENDPAAAVISKISASFLAGTDPQKPLVDAAVSATDIDAKTSKVGGFTIDHFTVSDAAELQRRFIDPFVPQLKAQKIVIESGQIYFAAAGSVDAGARSFSLTQCEASLPHLRISKAGKVAIDDSPKFNALASATTANGITSLVVSKLSLQSALADVTGQDIHANQPTAGASILTALPSAAITIATPDISRLQGVADVFGVAVPVDASGAFLLQTTVNKGNVNVVFQGNHFAVKNAKGQSFAFNASKPLTLHLAADLKGQTAIDEIDVNMLDGDFDVFSVSMPQKISVTNLSTTPVPSGQIELAGAIEKIAPLLQVIQSADTPLPYKGLFKFRQAVTTKGDDIALKGDGTIDNFEADDATGKAQFTEKQITIANDLTANPKTHHATISNVALEMTASQAARVQLSGAIANWDTSRTIEGSGLIANVKYDAAKLWPIVYAKLSADQQKSFANAKVVGAFEKKFTVTGKYPVAKTMGDSIRPLHSDGAIELTQFTSGGIDLQNLLLNLVLEKGVVTLTQQPAALNGGQMSLDKVQVDLTQADLRLFAPKNLPLLTKVSINPALGDTLGKYINPTFANSKQAKGLCTVVVNECRSLALGAALQTEKSGTAKLTINIQDMDIANPLGSLMLGPVLDKLGKGNSSDTDTFQGEIKDGKIIIDKGRTTQDLVMTLSRPIQMTDPATGKTTTIPKDMPLGFQGDISLSDLSETLKVSVPASLIASMAGTDEKNISDILPNGMPLVLKGTATAPKVDFGNIVSKIAEGLLKQKITGGNGDDSIDKLINGLGKKKKKKSADADQ